MSNWIDITVPLNHGMAHWPGDPDVVVERISNMDTGDMCNVSRLVMSSHTGTHMDAPLHYVKEGPGVDKFPAELMITLATVCEVDSAECIAAIDLSGVDLTKTPAILFKTRNSRQAPSREFRKDFIYIAPDAAELLANSGVSIVGIDYMSVGGFFQHSEETHVALLSAGVWLLENLTLRDIIPGVYEILCAPLLIANGDGAPARVLLRQR